VAETNWRLGGWNGESKNKSKSENRNKRQGKKRTMHDRLAAQLSCPMSLEAFPFAA
jgi:hypothetical protein